MKEITTVDFTIIGGGIIGLSLAQLMAKRFPGSEIALFEKAPFLGDQTTGRNSGVLHSGIYYNHQSLKHELCLEGHEQWKKSDVKVINCGKFIFARSEAEMVKLEEIFENGLKNKVPFIQWAGHEHMSLLKEDVSAIGAIYSPWTSIMDVPDAVKNMANKCLTAGIMLLPHQEVLKLERDVLGGFRLQVGNETFRTQVLFNCAGLEAVRLRKMLGLFDIEDHWVKGHYLTTAQKLSTNGLVYPVPEPELKGLGVHSTYDMSGKLKFGPDILNTDAIDYSFSDHSVEQMKLAVTNIFPKIDPTRLQADYAGIRSKIKVNGSLYSDFWIKRPLTDYIEFLGIESPGLTAAPAIAKYGLTLL